jgi:hypothetical protein
MNTIMAKTSGSDSYSDVQEKVPSSEKSDEGATKEAYNDKAAFPLNLQEPNISDNESSDSVKEVRCGSN